MIRVGSGDQNAKDLQEMIEKLLSESELGFVDLRIGWWVEKDWVNGWFQATWRFVAMKNSKKAKANPSAITPYQIRLC